MENTHSTFLVLKIKEDKDNGKTEITVDKGFNSMVDAKRYKDAKDLNERLTPSEYWVYSYKIQQIFYKSFVQEAKAS